MRTRPSSPLNLAELARMFTIVLKSVVAPQSRSYKVTMYFPSGDFASDLIVSAQSEAREKPQLLNPKVVAITKISFFTMSPLNV